MLLFVAGSFAVAAVAQTSSKIGFTQVPNEVTAGNSTLLKWSGGDSGSYVTITLQQGDPDNLQTVSILTGDATGNNYTWTPSTSLANADDYALKISQGVDVVNYSGEFSLTGGSSSSSVSSFSISSSSATSLGIGAPSVSASSSLSSFNGTVSSSMSSSNVSTPTTTVLGGAGSSIGTGIPMTRNVTMVSATLINSSSQSTAASNVTSMSIKSSVLTKTSGESSASGTAGISSTPGPKSIAASLASPIAFVLCAFAAIAYLS